MRTMLTFSAAFALAIAALAPSTAQAARLDCEMHFSLSGWSVFYKQAKGTGTIRCNNGQSMKVRIIAKGGGLTLGKSTVDDGLGKFSEVDTIGDLLGAYATAEAHAGAVRSADAQALTKGPVSLALSGKGRGWDLGVSFGKFVISRL